MHTIRPTYWRMRQLSLFLAIGLSAAWAQAQIATTTALAAAPNPAISGEQVTLEATVAAASGAAPSGKVAFYYGALKLGSATLVNGRANLTASTVGIPAGTYAIVAQYAGSATDAASHSSALNVALTTAAPAGTPLSACADLTTGGAYYLAQNVSAPGTCFFIDADNITLNLNGHTITYGTGGGTAPTPGILLADPWFTGYGIARTGTTLHHGGFVVANGAITAAANAAPRSAALWVGQSNGISPAPVVHDLALTTFAEDASPIFGTVSASGWQIYNNTLRYAALSTSSRYNLWGYALWIADDPNGPGATPDQIFNNRIIAAPQGGIFDDHQNALITNNDIAFNSFYANDYCVATLSGDNQTVSFNVCHPASGRGIDAEAAGETIARNTITVTELPQDAEYGGCELAGADGVRVRDNVYQGNPTAPTGIIVSNNTIVSAAGACQANGLRLTNLSATDSVTFTGNTVATSGAGTPAAPDYAISLDGVQQTPLAFSGNSFLSVYAWVEVDWDGANAAINGAETWAGAPLLALDDENGYNDQAEDGPTFAQSITVNGAQAGLVHCGLYAAGPADFGATTETCH